MRPIRRPGRLFDTVADRLREYVVAQVNPGDRIPSILALAAMFGVSPTTLRTAQALLVRDGFLDVRHGSGVFATGRARQRVVGIVSEMDLLHPRATPFVSEVARLLRDSLVTRGIRVELYVGTTVPWATPSGPSCPRLFEDMEAARLGGIAIVSAPQMQPWTGLIERNSPPTVSIARDIGLGDRESILTLGVARLQAQDCRRIAMLGWGGHPLRNLFRDAVASREMETRDGWIRTEFHPWLTGAGWEQFRELWSSYPEKPDGLLVCDDGLFAEALIAIDELGIRIPEHMRVVTHANKGSGIRYPFPVTLLQNDPALVAGILESKLLDLMDGKPRGEPTGQALEIIEIRGRRLKASGQLLSIPGNRDARS